MYAINCLWLIVFGLVNSTNIRPTIAHSVEENQAFIQNILTSLNNNDECNLPSFEEIDELQKSFYELAVVYGPNFDSSLTADQNLVLKTILDQWTSFRERMTSDIVIRSAKKRSFLNRVESYQKAKFGSSICSDITKIKGPIIDRIFEKNPHVRYIKHLQTNQIIERPEEDEFVARKVVLGEQALQEHQVEADNESMVAELEPSIVDASAGESAKEVESNVIPNTVAAELESMAESVDPSSQQASDDASESCSNEVQNSDEKNIAAQTEEENGDNNVFRKDDETFDYSRNGKIETSQLTTTSTLSDSIPKNSQYSSEPVSPKLDSDHPDTVNLDEQSIGQKGEQSHEPSVEESFSVNSPEASSGEPSVESSELADEQPDSSGLIHRMIGQYVVEFPGSGAGKISIQVEHRYEEPKQSYEKPSEQNLEDWYDPLVDIPIPSSSDSNQDAAQKDNYRPSAQFDFEKELRGFLKPQVVVKPAETREQKGVDFQDETDEFGADLIDASEDDADLERLVRVPPKDWDFDPVYGHFKWPDEIPPWEQRVELADNSISAQWVMFTNDPEQFELHLKSLEPKLNPGEMRRMKNRFKQKFVDERRVEREDTKYGWYGSSVGSILTAPETKGLRDRWIKLADNNLCKLDYNTNYIKEVSTKVSKKIFGQKKSW